jgi:hypothetical protein
LIVYSNWFKYQRLKKNSFSKMFFFFSSYLVHVEWKEWAWFVLQKNWWMKIKSDSLLYTTPLEPKAVANCVFLTPSQREQSTNHFAAY